mgnify:CR=1 FL=1
MVNAILNGCNGAMGRVITDIVSKDDGIRIVAGVDVNPLKLADYEVYETLDQCPAADVVIDFSSAKATDGVVAYCEKTKTPVDLCTTGLSEEQLERVKALGVIPSFFVAHVYHWGEIHVNKLGLDRAAAISPAGSALKLGIPFTFHQDSPVLPPDMVETLWCACVRRTKTGRVLGPEERIPVEAALRAVTETAAWQYGAEGADLVVLSGDPLKTDPEELKNLQVEKTIKDGRTIWSR